MSIELDDRDKRILAVLQREAKVSMQTLAERAGVSATQCWRRVRAMEDAGVIAGYRAHLDARKLGLEAIAFVHVALNDHQERHIAAFLRLVNTSDQIVECSSITGDHDFLLKIVAKTPTGLETFIMGTLLRSGLVRTTRSDFVLGHIKSQAPLPLLP